MFGKTGNLSFPFSGISLEKFYVEGDPMFDDKVEEISLSWKEEFERGKESAIAELLRDGGPAFFRVPWIRRQIQAWCERGDCESEIRLREIEGLVTQKICVMKDIRPFGDKTVMLKEYDGYLERYTILHEKRKKICGDCPRYRKDPCIVTCIGTCEYPGRAEALVRLAGDPGRVKTLFKYPPHRMAICLTAVDGEIQRKLQNGEYKKVLGLEF